MGDFVIVQYEEELALSWASQNSQKSGAGVSVMQRSGVNWRWPRQKD